MIKSDFFTDSWISKFEAFKIQIKLETNVLVFFKHTNIFLSVFQKLSSSFSNIKFTIGNLKKMPCSICTIDKKNKTNCFPIYMNNKDINKFKKKNWIQDSDQLNLPNKKILNLLLFLNFLIFSLAKIWSSNFSSVF